MRHLYFSAGINLVHCRVSPLSAVRGVRQWGKDGRAANVVTRVRRICGLRRLNPKLTFQPVTNLSLRKVCDAGRVDLGARESGWNRVAAWGFLSRRD